MYSRERRVIITFTNHGWVAARILIICSCTCTTEFVVWQSSDSDQYIT